MKKRSLDDFIALFEQMKTWICYCSRQGSLGGTGFKRKGFGNIYLSHLVETEKAKTVESEVQE